MTYRTIDGTSRAASQRAFLRALARGDAYRSEAPTLWDVRFRTAVAQAELEDREVPGAYHRITDTAFDTGQMRVGRRLATKLLNASRFVLGIAAAAPGGDDAVTEPLARALLARLAEVVDAATAAQDAYDHTAALERTEEFFWSFCDDCVELVKDRAYGEPGAVPAPDPLRALAGDAADPRLLGTAATAIAAIRRAKSEGRVSMRTQVSLVLVRGEAAALGPLREVLADVRAAGRVGDVALAETSAAEPEYVVTL